MAAVIGKTQPPALPDGVQEFFLTVGVQYNDHSPHPVTPAANSDGWIVIEALDKDMAREIGFALFGKRWAFVYAAEEFDAGYHPLGELGRVHIDFPLYTREEL